MAAAKPLDMVLAEDDEAEAEEDLVRSYDLGVNSSITKPVEFRQVVHVVMAWSQDWLEVQLPPKESSQGARPAGASR
jgi:DNA-binding response OmpR family regulator